jgi:hypothetical protein
MKIALVSVENSLKMASILRGPIFDFNSLFFQNSFLNTFIE